MAPYQLLGTEAYRNALANELRAANHRVMLISAYLTKKGIEWISNRLTNDDVECNIVARWKVTDLLSNASNLDAYEVISKRGWNLHILNDLHAKIFLIDNNSLFVGSANLTGYGLSLVPSSNREMGVKISPSESDISSINGIFEESTYVTPAIFQEMKDFIDNLKPQIKEKETYEWPLTLQDKLQNKISRLWVADLMWTSSPEDMIYKLNANVINSNDCLHDFAILGFEPERYKEIDLDTLKTAFLNTKVWKWLEGELLKTADYELQFGAVTKLLHDCLLDDPAPYRKDVKGLQVNLFNWIKVLKIPRVSIDVPGMKSERIRII